MATPGKLYVVRQESSTLFWQVVQVDRDQGAAMRRRGEPHVYDTAAQAHAVRRELNVTRAPREVAPTRGAGGAASGPGGAPPAAPEPNLGPERRLRGRVTGRDGLLWWVVRCDEAPEPFKVHYLTPRQVGRDRKIGDEVTLVYRSSPTSGEWVVI